MHRIEPLGYMRDLLCLLPRWPKHRVLDVAPVNWTQTVAQTEVQQALAANAGGSGLRLRVGLGLGVRCGSLGHLLCLRVGGLHTRSLR
ncbi:MAG: hypothetical protein ABSF35_24265 [Polyangia bacterium]|jgi:hypothetical protein